MNDERTLTRYEKAYEEVFGVLPRAARGHRVVHGTVEEWCKEIEDDRDLVERGIVRVCFAYKQPHAASPMFRLHVYATAIVADNLVRLDWYAGELLNTDAPADDPTWVRASETVRKIKVMCDALGFTLRAGSVES